MKQILPIYEFILWDNCSNNCSFCLQRMRHEFINDTEKIESIRKVSSFIDGIDNGSHVLLVGGEIFDSKNAKINDELKIVYEKIESYMESEKIGYLYINTNLIYDMNTILFSILDMLCNKGMINRIRFTTSDDMFGRFSDDTRRIFNDNLMMLRSRYEKMNIIVNTIMSKQFCRYVIDNNVDYCGDYMRRTGCRANIIPFINTNKFILPSKQEVLKTLSIMENFNPGYMDEYIGNFNLKQQKKIYKFDGNELVYSSSDVSDCGHGENFKKYSTDNRCFICDIMEVFG